MTTAPKRTLPVFWPIGVGRIRKQKRLRARMEEMLLKAEVYALGQHLSGVVRINVLTKLDETCRYLLENTYTKLEFYIQGLPARSVA